MALTTVNGVIKVDHEENQGHDKVTGLEYDMSDGIYLDTLAPADTITLQTRNSNYRIFLLDPGIGRALIEGGNFVEPVEALVNGSVKNSTLNPGWVGVGARLEFWTDGQFTSTSPIQSFHIEAHTPAEATSRLVH